MTKSRINRLVIIDGHAILHRAYHAFPSLTTRSGELVNAVYGFTTMLLRIISDFKPKYLAVAFDTEKPTFRQAEYIGYQAHRPKMEEELKGQIEKVYEVLTAMGIPIFQKEGFEADDVIGTLVGQAIGKPKTQKTEEIEVVIVTGDRDMMQLVGPKVKVYAPTKGFSGGKLFDEREVRMQLGVEPKQIVDYKGLIGDPSDNYPGVPGIGPKTAVTLLKRYKSLENIYQALGVDLNKGINKKREKNFKNLAPSLITGSIQKKLLDGVESARLSQKLAKIVTNVPLKLNLEKCEFKFGKQEREKAIKKFEELGFKSLVARLSKEEGKFSDSQENFQQKLF